MTTKIGTFFFSDGTQQDVFDFDCQEENQRKILISENGNDGEGIWVCMNPKDMKDYSANKSDSNKDPYRFAALRNASLHMGPHSWGAIVPYKLRGRDRPEFNLAWVDMKKNGKFLFCLKDFEEISKLVAQGK